MNYKKAHIIFAFSTQIVVGFLYAVFFVSPAYAGADIGTAISSLDASTDALPTFFELLAYISGLYALYSGINALREASQKPGEKPLKPAVIRLMIAGALIALPRTIVTVTSSFNSDITKSPTVARPKFFQ